MLESEITADGEGKQGCRDCTLTGAAGQRHPRAEQTEPAGWAGFGAVEGRGTWEGRGRRKGDSRVTGQAVVRLQGGQPRRVQKTRARWGMEPAVAGQVLAWLARNYRDGEAVLGVKWQVQNLICRKRAGVDWPQQAVTRGSRDLRKLPSRGEFLRSRWKEGRLRIQRREVSETKWQRLVAHHVCRAMSVGDGDVRRGPPGQLFNCDGFTLSFSANGHPMAPLHDPAACFCLPCCQYSWWQSSLKIYVSVCSTHICGSVY